MTETPLLNYSTLEITNALFKKMGAFIQETYGIKMPPTKKSMLQARLQKRLRHLGMISFEDYYEYVFSPEGEAERIHMIDSVTTNKTDFFREPAHFEFLENRGLNALLTRYRYNSENPVRVWSAGCSTGEEPYTVAMVLDNFARAHHGFHFQILATDLSSRVLQKAKEAIYPGRILDTIPQRFRKGNLLRSRDRQADLIRVAPNLRKKIQFERLNFLDSFEIKATFDIVFCRNVIIYFKQQTQKQLLWKFYQHLKPGGYLFLGHSETIHGLGLPLISVIPTVYQKK